MSDLKRTILASGRGEWAFNEVFEAPDYDDPTGPPYLIRRRIISTPMFGVYLHKINGPDPRPTFHDHPWSFVSIVLSGWYKERTPRSRTPKMVRRRNVKRNSDHEMGVSAHYITEVSPGGCWTLLFVGRRRGRSWGYWEDPRVLRGTQMGLGPPVEWEWTRFDEHRYNDDFKAALASRQETEQ